MVAPRSISAWAQSPDRAPHAKVCARRLSCAFAAGSGCSDGKQPGHHPLDVAVDRHDGSPEGDGRNGGSRVGPDARQLQQLGFRRREAAAMALGDDLRALVQIAGAAVVAKPRPGGEDVIQGRFGQRLHRRPAGEERLVVGDDRLDGRLLQHDLRQPDARRDRVCAACTAARADRAARGRTSRAARRWSRGRAAASAVALLPQISSACLCARPNRLAHVRPALPA